MKMDGVSHTSDGIDSINSTDEIEEGSLIVLRVEFDAITEYRDHDESIRR